MTAARAQLDQSASVKLEQAAYSYKPVPGVHYPAIGYVHIKRAILNSLLPPLQLLGWSSYLDAHPLLIDRQVTGYPIDRRSTALQPVQHESQ